MTKAQSNLLIVCAVAAVGLLGALVLKQPAPERQTYAEKQKESTDAALQDHYRLMCDGFNQDCDKVDD